MTALIPSGIHVVASKLQRRHHHLVVFPPTAEQRIPSIVLAILQEDAQRFGLGFAHYGWEIVASAHSHEGAHGAIHAAE